MQNSGYVKTSGTEQLRDPRGTCTVLPQYLELIPWSIPSWEGNIQLDKKFRLWQNPNVHYRVHTSLLLVSMLSFMNPVHILCFFKKSDSYLQKGCSYYYLHMNGGSIVGTHLLITTTTRPGTCESRISQQWHCTFAWTREVGTNRTKDHIQHSWCTRCNTQRWLERWKRTMKLETN